MWRAYFNTFLYVVPTTLLMLLTCVLAAYPLTYKNLRGENTSICSCSSPCISPAV